MNPYTAERRDVLENTPHEAQEISQGRSPSGNIEGRGVQNPRPREILGAEGGVYSNASRLEAVYIQTFSQH